MEGDVLAALNYSLLFATPFDFLMAFLAQMRATALECFLSLVG